MNEKRLDIVRLHNIVQGFGRSVALISAVELGIFTTIDDEANTTGTVSAALDIHQVNAERLLIMLTAMELVHRLDDGTNANVDDIDRVLVEDKKSYAAPWILFSKPQCRLFRGP